MFPPWPRTLGCRSLLMAHLEGSAFTFASLHVVPDSLPSVRTKSSSQVPSTHICAGPPLQGQGQGTPGTE